MVSKLEEETRRLIALKLLASVTGSFGDRADRKFGQVREDIGKSLKERSQELPKDSGLAIKLGWSDEAVTGARKINLAIAEFKQEYPEYGEKLHELIDKHRSTRRAYLEFGGAVGDDIYIAIVQEIIGGNKTSYEQASEIYRAISSIGELFGKNAAEVQKSLLSE